MKKLITTVAFCVLLTNVYAQNNFKTIAFSKYLTTQHSPMMKDNGSYGTMTTETVKAGTIDINRIESIITIKRDGRTDEIYIIKKIYEERADAFKNMNTSISCKNRNGDEYFLTITKNDNYESMGIMKVKIENTSGYGDDFTCSFLKDLYQN